MAKRKTEIKEKLPNSIFRKLEITCIRDIFEVCLFREIDQQLIDYIAIECGNFLLKKGISPDLINKNFSFFLKFEEKEGILLLGANLLSSLWIIDVYPDNPEKLINCSTYNDGDFVYKFYTKNKNLSITKIKKNERKSTSNQ